MDKKTKIIIGASVVGILAIIGIVYFVSKNRNKKTISSGDWKTPNGIDINTNGYKILIREIQKTEEVLKGYEKDGLVLKNTSTGDKSSESGAKATYWMQTKNFPTIKSGIERDKALDDTQRKLLLSIYNDYFNLYLPSYFNQQYYNPNAEWYKELGDKAIDKYKI